MRKLWLLRTFEGRLILAIFGTMGSVIALIATIIWIAAGFYQAEPGYIVSCVFLAFPLVIALIRGPGERVMKWIENGSQ